MSAKAIYCPDCGHAKSKHYDPLRGSENNVYCKGATINDTKACRCSLRQSEVARKAEVKL